MRAMLGRYRGVEQDVAGDGFFATFDGPARGVKCAQAIVDAVQAGSSSKFAPASTQAKSALRGRKRPGSP